jgi:hypothetical protein
MMCQRKSQKKFLRIQDSTVGGGDRALSTLSSHCPKLYVMYPDDGRREINPPKYQYTSYS